MKMGIFSRAEVENTSMVNILKNFRINTLTELKKNANSATLLYIFLVPPCGTTATHSFLTKGLACGAPSSSAIQLKV